jgi:hypothetical protein
MEARTSAEKKEGTVCFITAARDISDNLYKAGNITDSRYISRTTVY